MPLTLPSIVGGSLVSAVALLAYHATYSVRSQLLGATHWHGRTDANEVALTFDDGPSEDTEMLLDVLAELEVSATFFMVGQQVERFPETAQRVVACGHEIGNHSYSHLIYLYRGARETRSQLERTQDVIAEVTGVIPRLSRPPCGVRTPAYFAAARELDLRTVQWTVAGFDWKQHDAERIAHDVVRKATAGSIILLHDGDSAGKRDRRATVAAIPIIVAGLQSRGLRVAPLTQLLQVEKQQIHLNPEATYD
jgi:peptidoglycan/xylan/chitin deacetylase (PgdA/CDA1 family)